MVSLHSRELNLKQFTILSLFKMMNISFCEILAHMRKSKKLLVELMRTERRWLEMSILNIAQSGHFASDRTILQYSNEIWGIGNTVTQI